MQEKLVFRAAAESKVDYSSYSMGKFLQSHLWGTRIEKQNGFNCIAFEIVTYNINILTKENYPVFNVQYIFSYNELPNSSELFSALTYCFNQFKMLKGDKFHPELIKYFQFMDCPSFDESQSSLDDCLKRMAVLLN